MVNDNEAQKKLARSPRIRFSRAKEVSETEWELSFTVDTPGCEGSTGSFDYQLVVADDAGRTYVTHRSAPSWATGDSFQGAFVFIDVVKLSATESVHSVRSVTNVQFNCQFPAKKRRLPSANAVNLIDASSAGGAEIILQLVYAYAILKDSQGDYGKLIGGVADQLKGLGKTLTAMLNQVVEISEALKKLPRIIQEIVYESELRDAISIAQSNASKLADFTRSEVIDQNTSRIDAALDGLHDQAFRILGDGNSYHRLLCAAPYLAIWMAAGTACEKTKKKNDSTYKILSPWSAQIVRFYKESIETMLEQTALIDQEYSLNLTPHFPPRNRRLRISGKFFTPVYVPPSPPDTFPPIGGGQEGEVRISNDNISPEKICFYRSWRQSDGYDELNLFPGQPPLLQKKEPTCGGGVGLQRGFWTIPPFETFEEQEALRRYSELQTAEANVTAFYALFARVAAQKSEVLGTFNEPANIWS